MAAGRPRAFDPDEALDAALKVFWEKGYEGASLPDLTAAMGINRPSLYATFGNKEELFRKAVARYSEQGRAFMSEALSTPTAREAIERLLMGVIDSNCHAENPRGCLLVQAALACGDEAEPVRRELIARRAEAEALLCARFEQGIRDGDLSAETNAQDLARFYFTVMHGIAVQTASGVTQDAVRPIVDLALRAWPA